jgi:hypothetical protein
LPLKRDQFPINTAGSPAMFMETSEKVVDLNE